MRGNRLDSPASGGGNAPTTPPGPKQPAPTESPSSGLERQLITALYDQLGRPAVRLSLWDDYLVGQEHPESRPRIVIRRRASLYRLLVNPALHFGEDFSRGYIEVHGDLVEAMRTLHHPARDRFIERPLAGLTTRLLNRPRRNTLTGSRRNIHQHYDLGNDFYRLWLDEAMVYTCAYFPDPAYSLEAAQRAKMEHVARKLRLKPGERVLEVGCGWGSLARYLAREKGVTVRAFNISHEQMRLARTMAEEEGLGDRVEFIEDDYRNATGQYDAFVSVGMLEHVGPEHYTDLGRVIDRCLRPDGRALLHTIGKNRPSPFNPWIERYIFPGAHPPTLSEIMQVLEPWAFSVQDVENLRLHYARTLEHWLERFERHRDTVRARFDETFTRMWRLYLSGSVASFDVGGLQLFQVTFTRPRNNELPWTRAYLYDRPTLEGESV